MFWWFVLCAGLIAADQITKHLARIYLSDGSIVPVINHVLDLVYVENRGAAFGFFQDTRWLLVGLTSAILCAAAAYMIRHKDTHKLLSLSVTLIFAGGLGNLIDRAINGYVVDFFHILFIDFPCFNVADTCVSIGCVLLAIYLLFLHKEPKEAKQ